MLFDRLGNPRTDGPFTLCIKHVRGDTNTFKENSDRTQRLSFVKLRAKYLVTQCINQFKIMIYARPP